MADEGATRSTSFKMQPDTEKTACAEALSDTRLREENIWLRSQLARLSLLSSRTRTVSAATTSSKTRLELEALKKELAERDRISRLQDVRKIVSAAQALDLAFLFDATGSMGCFLQVVKNRITKIAQGISQAYPNSLIRVAFVFYRDYDDKEICGSFDFTQDFNGSTSAFVKALMQVKAEGGGDVAEDVFSGLERLAKLDWRSHNRVVYHIADAPCHGTRFHDGTLPTYDKHPQGDLKGRNIASLLGNLRDGCKVSTFTFLHIHKSHTEKMLKEFKQAAARPSTDNWICEDNFEGMELEDIPAKVVSACTSTISHSLSTMTAEKMRSASSTYVPREVRKEMPSWDDITVQEGSVYKFKKYKNVEEVLRHIKEGVPLDLEITRGVQVQLGRYPFSKAGASRWPFYAQVVDQEFERRVMVVKRFKQRLRESTAEVHKMERYIEQRSLPTWLRSSTAAPPTSLKPNRFLLPPSRRCKCNLLITTWKRY